MNELEQLRKENAELKEQIRKFRYRGAGRPQKLNAYQISNIKNAHKQGKSYKQIADTYKCSTSLICKIINS